MQSVNLTTTPATCGENDGAIAIGAVNGGQGAYQYRIDENWISNPTWIGFSQLAAGAYTLSVKDQNNCYLHQPFSIGEVNPAEAAFTASPSSGYAPLAVDFINQSNGSNNYQWSLADSAIYSFDFSHTFDSAGSYPVQLVSWYNLPHCADTASTTVVVHPELPDYNHTIVFPTDYNPQHGLYAVETTNIERMEWQVYNAVGQHIFSNTVETSNGSTALWDGGGHARGYYFFRARYWDLEGTEHSGRGKVLLMR